MVSGRGQRLRIAGNALAGFGRVKGMAQAGLRQCRFWAARLQPQLQFAIRNLHPQPESRIPQFAAQSPVSLQKQEWIKGPENASIARFDGLCCYQSGSETAMVSGRGRQREAGAGVGRAWARSMDAVRRRAGRCGRFCAGFACFLGRAFLLLASCRFLRLPGLVRLPCLLLLPFLLLCLLPRMPGGGGGVFLFWPGRRCRGRWRGARRWRV